MPLASLVLLRARQARDKFPGLDRKLGRLIEEHGNRPMRLMRMADGTDLGSFPVKHTWREQADLDLIEDSARLLVELVDKFGYSTVFLPRMRTVPSLPWSSSICAKR